MADEKTVKLPSAKLLTSLINQSNTAKEKAGAINGELGEKIAKAVEDHNLHAAAFKTARKLRNMDPVKLNAWLTHFDDYRAKLKLDDLAGDTLLDEEGGEGGEAEEDGKDAGTATELDEHGRPKPMFQDPPPPLN